MKRLLNTNWLLAIAVSSAMALSGCENTGAPAEKGEKDAKTAMSEKDGSTSTASTDKDESQAGKALSPENTMILFVGRHTDKSKDDRKGGFQKFTGSMETTGDGNMPTFIVLDIETDSIWTEIENLTQHLKSTDFFNVREFPQCKFQSTEIEPSEDGMCTVTGDLTILGNTKSISFPAKVSTEDGELKLEAEFNIDRTEFGMNYGEDSIEKEVTLTFMIGKANE